MTGARNANDIPRAESGRLLTGRGRFIDTVVLPRMLQLAFLRSPVAHATLDNVDVTLARAKPGVVGVFNADDFAPIIAEMPQTKLATLPNHTSPPQPPLVSDTIRHQGEPIAVVAAETLALAQDGVEAVTLSFTELPVIATRAAADGHDDHVASAIEVGPGLPATVGATHLEANFAFGRQTGVTLEPRGIVCAYDPVDQKLEVWHSHQSPHMVQTLLARILGLPENRVLVRVGDVGGGFGVKLHLYADEIAAAVTARILGRPVKYVASRMEAFQSDAQAREFDAVAAISLSPEGELLGFEGDFTNAIGAYSIYPRASVGDAAQAASQLGAPYKMTGLKARARTVWQNKPPSGPIRGVGQPIPCTVTEQLMDLAARHLGEDPAQFRRRHYLAAEDFPLTTLGGVMMDRLSLRECLDEVLEAMSYDELRSAQQSYRAMGRLWGIGIATFVEQTAVGPRLYGGTGIPATSIEECQIRLESDGSFRVETGATDQGQGTLTGICQIVARTLDIDISRVDVVTGNSGGARGGGAWASRGLSLAGEAAVLASETLRENILELGGALLQKEPTSLHLADGEIRGIGGESLQLAELARVAWYTPYDLPNGATNLLTVSRSYTLKDRPYLVANGIQGSLVEVDVETGAVTPLQQWVVEDCGNIINPGLVDGQIMGGTAQGIGGAIGERCYYDEAGQLISASFLDYAVPRADSVPPIDVRHIVTPQVGLTLGIKGVGEAGNIGAPAAIWSAVNDAIAHLGAHVTSQPITAEVVFRAISKAARDGAHGNFKK